MTEDQTDVVFHLPPLPKDELAEDTEYAWSRQLVILNTLATIAGAFTGLAALVIAVIALTS